VIGELNQWEQTAHRPDLEVFGTEALKSRQRHDEIADSSGPDGECAHARAIIAKQKTLLSFYPQRIHAVQRVTLSKRRSIKFDEIETF
jgi:hypothetical protein